MPLSKKEIAELYVAYFDRAPDHDGLEYWATQDEFNDMGHLAESFYVQPETQAKYPATLSDAEFIDEIYQHLFGRHAEQSGIDYWVSRLNPPEDSDYPAIDRAHMIEAILLGAQNGDNGNDLDIINNKVEVGLYVADTLGLNIDDFYLNDITDDPATVEAAKVEAQNYIPQEFALTTGIDTLEGNLGDDTFDAYDRLNSLNSNDTITDPSTTDNDILKVKSSINIDDTVTVANIENIDVEALGGIEIDMDSMGGIKSFTNDNSIGKITLQNISSADMAFGFKGDMSNEIEAHYKTDVLSGDSDTMSMKLYGAEDVQIDSDAGFENLVINTIDDSNISSLNMGTTLKNVEITGDKNLTIGDDILDNVELTISGAGQVALGNATGISLIEAEDNSGGVVAKSIDPDTGFATSTIHTVTGENDVSIVLLGSGDDNINIEAQSDLFGNTVIKTNGGNDRVKISSIGSGDVNISTGEGDDALYLAVDIDGDSSINMGEGENDTIAVAPDNSYTLNATGVESINIMNAETISGTTTIDLSNITNTLNITDLRESSGAVTITGLLNGSTFSATKAAVGDLDLEFQNNENATITIDAQQGIDGSIKLVNVQNATIKTGADSAVTDITVDEHTTNLTVDATGNFGSNMNIPNGSTPDTDENLENLSITATGAISLGSIENDYSLKTLTIKSTGSNGSIDGTSLLGSDAKDIDNITVESVGSIGNTTAPSINAESVGTISITSSNGAAKISAITVKDDTNHDGGIDSMTINGKSGVAIANGGDITVDKIDSLSLNSSNGGVTTGAFVATNSQQSTLGDIEAEGNNSVTIGNIGSSSNEFASLNSIEATSSNGSVTIDGIYIQNSNSDSNIEHISASGHDGVTLGGTNGIHIDNIGDITATSSNGVVTLGTITTTASNATIGDIQLSGNSNITLNGISAASGSSISSIGDIALSSSSNVILDGDITVDDSNKLNITIDAEGKIIGNSKTITNTKGDLEFGLSSVSSDMNDAFTLTVGDNANGTPDLLNLKFNASGIDGGLGTSSSNMVFNNYSTSDAANTQIALGDGTNYIKVIAKGGSVEVAGGTGSDYIDLSDIDSTVSLEINGGAGTDTVKFGTAISADSLTNHDLMNVENIIITNTNSATYDFSAQTEDLNITASSAQDTIKGGSGDDTVIADDEDTIDGGAGIDTVKFGATVSASNLTDDDLTNIENIIITNINNTSYDFSVQTEDLNIIGGSAQDTIKGGAGNDTIIGGAGSDTLTGGNGRDTFTFVNKGGSTSSMDTITDFNHSDDTIDFQTSSGTPSGDFITFNSADTEFNVDVSSANSLEEAINIALGAKSANSSGDADLTTFEYNNNTYIVYDNDGSDTQSFDSSNDFVIKLTGTGLSLDSSDINIDGSALA